MDLVYPITEQKIVGWREWLSLPEFGVPAIKAKIDTGARTSALHVCNLHKVSSEGRDQVAFTLHPLQKREDIEFECVADVVDERLVRDSGGHTELRFVISTPVRFAGVECPIEVTLTNRENMLFRMLLGRTALRDSILVNCRKSYLTGKSRSNIYDNHTRRTK